MASTDLQADVAVIGGSGFYELDGDAPTIEPGTPWGPPSSPITIGTVEGRRVAFLARHGRNHALPPHAVDHRANLWALRELGVHTVLASFACGSLVPDLGPGSLLVPDQLIDRTTGRADTIHATFDAGPQHAAFAEPYGAAARQGVLDVAGGLGEAVHDGGTVVVINGPRFATKAESRWYRSIGADVINMTQYPETVIARELGLAYAAVGLVTDHDAGLDEDPDVEAVTMDAVFEVFAQHLPRLRNVLLAAAATVAS
ncbi:MAG: S-methyl-5'-thioadenosine phosphorylase [Actinomycetota bacterium]|nr:S-methyl-5'-thioadenosine phosphorylase [Actinomycetota bacterium]